MTNAQMPDRFVTVDENGWLIFENRQIEDASIAREFYTNLHYLPNRSFASQIMNQTVIVEAFDSPMMVQAFNYDTSTANVVLSFNYDQTWDLTASEFTSEVMPRLFVDSFDRLMGETQSEIPFTFTKKAHEEFLNSLDEFDDDSVVFNGQRYPIGTFFRDETHVESADWWNQIYTGETPSITSPEHQKPSAHFTVNPAWNLEETTATLKDMLPRMKLPKSRILILGCGDSHDAAFFAQSGHKVTAVDISQHAIERSKKLYGHLDNITWLQSDIFKLPQSFDGAFDLVYEYTCLCAINPLLRNQLVSIWSRALHDQGQLMATFFCMHKRDGPPFGGSEWEFRELLKKRFQPLLWNRWRKSIPRRQGRELFVLAQKKTLI